MRLETRALLFGVACVRDREDVAFPYALNENEKDLKGVGSFFG